MKFTSLSGNRVRATPSGAHAKPRLDALYMPAVRRHRDCKVQGTGPGRLSKRLARRARPRTQQEHQRLREDGLLALGGGAVLLLPRHAHAQRGLALAEAPAVQRLARQAQRALHEHVQHAALRRRGSALGSEQVTYNLGNPQHAILHHEAHVSTRDVDSQVT